MLIASVSMYSSVQLLNRKRTERSLFAAFGVRCSPSTFTIHIQTFNYVMVELNDWTPAKNNILFSRKAIELWITWMHNAHMDVRERSPRVASLAALPPPLPFRWYFLNALLNSPVGDSDAVRHLLVFNFNASAQTSCDAELHASLQCRNRW